MKTFIRVVTRYIRPRLRSDKGNERRRFAFMESLNAPRRKKLLSVILTALLVATTLPAPAIAAGFGPMSILPLDEAELTANLVIASASEKDNVQLRKFLNSLEYAGGSRFYSPNIILWNYGTMDDPAFQEITPEDTVDLSSLNSGDKLMFIGGDSANQFDSNNVRYIVTLNFESLPAYADVELYSETASQNAYITGSRVYFEAEPPATPATLQLPPNSDLPANYRLLLLDPPAVTGYYTVSVYKDLLGEDAIPPDDTEADVTNAIFSSDGLTTTFAEAEPQSFTFVFRSASGSVLEIKYFSVQAEVLPEDSRLPRHIDYGLKAGADDEDNISSSYAFFDGDYVNTINVPAIKLLSEDYYLWFDPLNLTSNYYTVKIYDGSYSDESELESAEEITDSVLAPSAYPINFGAEYAEKRFTFLFEMSDSGHKILKTLSIAASYSSISVPSFGLELYQGDTRLGCAGGYHYDDGSGDPIHEIFSIPQSYALEDTFILRSNANLASESNLYAAKVYASPTSMSDPDIDVTDQILGDGYPVSFGGEATHRITFVFTRKADGALLGKKSVIAGAAEASVGYPSYVDAALSLSATEGETPVNVGSRRLYFGSGVNEFSISREYPLDAAYTLKFPHFTIDTDIYTAAIYINRASPDSAGTDVTDALLGDGYAVRFADRAEHIFTFVFTRKYDSKVLKEMSITVGAVEAAVGYPSGVSAVLSATEGEAPIRVGSMRLYFRSDVNKFSISRKYSLDAAYALRFTDFQEETDIYTAAIYAGGFTEETDIPTEAEANVTEALLSDGGYPISFADGATPSFTVVFTGKRDDKFLAAIPFAIGAEYRVAGFPGSAEFELFAPGKDRNGAKKSEYERIDARIVSLNPSKAPTVFLLVQPKIHSLRDDKFGVTAVPFVGADLVTEVYEGVFSDQGSLTEDARITEAFYGERGYETDFGDESGERAFTFVCVNQYYPEEIRLFPVIVRAAYYTGNLSDYDKITFTGAEDKDVYKVRAEDDSYTQFGYQTFFVGNSSSIDDLAPTFVTEGTVGVYASGERQESGITKQSVRSGSILYTAIAEDTKTAANYQVRFLTQDRVGAQLFVNGPETREVYFDDIYGHKHDILIANIGGDTLRDITVSLEDAVNIKLDDYWTANSDYYSRSLAPFSTVDSTVTEYGQLPNIAKIRLLPDEAGDGGEISGRLRITAYDGYAGERETTYIELTGFAGKPELATGEITPAVRYVPYSFVLQTDNIHNDKTKPLYNQVRFEHISGLPAGLELFPNGEIYGAPKESGTFTIRVRITHSLFEGDEPEEAEFTLIVYTNTDYYVDRSVDPGYEIIQRVDNMTAAREQIFEVRGGFTEFIDFWLNGERLRRDLDYVAEDGSTVITIRSQTFRTAGNGTHTIAAEFRIGGDTDKDLMKAAQNYILRISGSGGANEPGGSGNDPGGSGEEPGGSGEEPGGSGEEPGGSGEEPGGSGEEPGGSGEEPGGSGEEPGGSGEEPGGSGEEPGGSGNGGNSGGGIISGGGGVSASIAVPNIIIAATVQGTTSTAVIRTQTLSEAVGARKGITVTSLYGDVAIDAEAVSIIGAAGDVSASYTVAAGANGEITISLTLSRNGGAITSYGRGIVTISVPYVLPSGARWTQVVPYLRTSGGLGLVMGGYNVNTRRVDIYLRHLSDYVIKINDKPYEGRGVRYDPSLDWAAQRGLLDRFIDDDGVISAGLEVGRGDFIAALVKALGIQPPAVFTVAQFLDVNGENAAYIRAAREIGLVGGVGENRFEPDRSLTRGELFQIMSNLVRMKISTVNSQNTNRKISDFEDANTIPEWLKPTLGKLLELGIVHGDGTKLRVKDSFDVEAFCAALQNVASSPIIRALN